MYQSISQMDIDEAREKSMKILQEVERLGFTAIIFKVDVGWESKRTLEARTNKSIPGCFPRSCLRAFMAFEGRQDRKPSWDDIARFRVGVPIFNFCLS